MLRAADFRPDDAALAARAARAASLVSADVAGATAPAALTGVALDHARGMVSAALATLERLGDHGWRTVAGDPPSGVRARPTRHEMVAERTEPFDPFAPILGPRG